MNEADLFEVCCQLFYFFHLCSWHYNLLFPAIPLCQLGYLNTLSDSVPLVSSYCGHSMYLFSHSIPLHATGLWGLTKEVIPSQSVWQTPWCTADCTQPCNHLCPVMLIKTSMIAWFSGTQQLTSTSSYMLFLIPSLAAGLTFFLCMTV